MALIDRLVTAVVSLSVPEQPICWFLAGALADALVLPVFVALIPQMIVSYTDAAALMLANLDRGNKTSRRRVGLALPVGMQGRKAH